MVPFVRVICEIFYIFFLSNAVHVIDYIIETKFTYLHLVAENTSETLKLRSVLNVDKCFKERKYCITVFILSRI